MSSRLGPATDLKNPRKNTHWQLGPVLPSPQMSDEKPEDFFFIPFDPEICQGTGIEKGTTFFTPSISVSHSLCQSICSLPSGGFSLSFWALLPVILPLPTSVPLSVSDSLQKISQLSTWLANIVWPWLHVSWKDFSPVLSGLAFYLHRSTWAS